MEADASVRKEKRNEMPAETITILSGAAYELQRKQWEKQLQPHKVRPDPDEDPDNINVLGGKKHG